MRRSAHGRAPPIAALIALLMVAASGCARSSIPASAAPDAMAMLADSQAEVADVTTAPAAEVSATVGDVAAAPIDAVDAPAALFDTADAGDACPATDCAPAKLCKAQETACDGNTLRICASGGQSWNLMPCLPGTSCGVVGSKANCLPWQCKPAATTCDGTAIVACAANGLAATVTEDCAQPDPGGQPRQCVGGQCLVANCPPGTAKCAGSATVAVCEANGAGWQALPCPSGKVCVLGMCVAVVCEPGKARCVGTAIGACSASGAAWQATKQCPANTYCVDEFGPPTCEDFKCAPGKILCGDNGSVTTCSGDGTKYYPTSCGPGSSCMNGGCEPLPKQQTAIIAAPTGPWCAGSCPVAPACSADDGCGVPCPACKPDPHWVNVCNSGSCAACKPNCGGKLCGPDGCGGWCGSCPAPLVCSGGACLGACANCPVGGCKLMGFELGMTGWTATGDTAVVAKFGEQLPPTGTGMLRLSTGVASLAAGTATTVLCPTANASKLRFKSRFCSTEFPSYCGSQYQDRLWMRLANAGKPVEIFAVRVDDFCSGGPWTLTPSIVKLGDLSVQCGPWLQTTIEISQFLPEGTLTLGVSNGIDGGYPSAALIDDIELLP